MVTSITRLGTVVVLTRLGTIAIITRLGIITVLIPLGTVAIITRLGMIALFGMMFSRMGKFVKNNRLARDIVLLYTKNGNLSSQTDSQLGK